jgi:hypothetical protein
MKTKSALTGFPLVALALLAVQAAVLILLFGQPAICACGYVKLWEGDVLSAGTSQHIADWYSFTHIIHGFLFYLLTFALLPKLTVPQRLLIAIGLEAGWEILENAPFFVQLYRRKALAQGYVGDSVLNSLSDVFMMSLGFVLAWRLPVWAVIGLALALEAALAVAVHDNLTLNLLNFIYPLDAVHRWQSGG